MRDLLAWVLANSEWLAFPGMGLFGATVGHVMAFDTSPVKWSYGQHFWMVLSAWIKGLFIGTCLFWFQQWAQWNLPAMFLATGIFSVFGSRSILWAYQKFIRYLDNGTNQSSEK